MTNFILFLGSFPAMKCCHDDRPQTPISLGSPRGCTHGPPPLAVSAPPSNPQPTSLTNDMPIMIPLGAATALFNRITTLQKEANYFWVRYEQLLALSPLAKRPHTDASMSGRQRPLHTKQCFCLMWWWALFTFSFYVLYLMSHRQAFTPLSLTMGQSPTTSVQRPLSSMWHLSLSSYRALR